MRAQKGGAHRHAKHLAQAARHAQLLAFMLQRQAVARFDLDGAHTLCQQGLQARGRLCEEFVFRSRTRGLDGRHNAATRLGDLFVGGTCQAQGELVGALAAVHQMGVAIDQARRDQGARPLPARQVLPSGGHCRIGPHPLDLPLLHHDADAGAGRHRHIGLHQGLHWQQAVPDAIGAGARAG